MADWAVRLCSRFLPQEYPAGSLRSTRVFYLKLVRPVRESRCVDDVRTRIFVGPESFHGVAQVVDAMDVILGPGGQDDVGSPCAAATAASTRATASERFSDAFVARAVGLPIKTDVFLFGLTWERYGEMKTQKLRVHTHQASGSSEPLR